MTSKQTFLFSAGAVLLAFILLPPCHADSLPPAPEAVVIDVDGPPIPVNNPSFVDGYNIPLPPEGDPAPPEKAIGEGAYSVTTVNGISTTNAITTQTEAPFGYSYPPENIGSAPTGELRRDPLPVTVTIEVCDELTKQPHTTLVITSTNDMQFIKWRITP